MSVRVSLSLSLSLFESKKTLGFFFIFLASVFIEIYRAWDIYFLLLFLLTIVLHTYTWKSFCFPMNLCVRAFVCVHNWCVYVCNLTNNARNILSIDARIIEQISFHFSHE